MRGLEHRLVLDRRDGGAASAALVARRQRRADDRQVVGFGAARGEDHLARLGAERCGDLLAGLLQPGAGGAPEAVGAGGIAEAFRPRKGSIASSTSGRTGVVAAWSR